MHRSTHAAARHIVLVALAVGFAGVARPTAVPADGTQDPRIDLAAFEDDARLPPDAPVQAVVAEAAPTGDVRVDALLSPYQWSSSPVSYSFYTDSVFGGQYYGTETGVREVGESVKRNVRAILDWYETMMNVEFIEVAETPSSIGQIRFMFSDTTAYAYAYYPTSPAMFHLSGDIHLSSAYDRLGDTNGFQHSAGEHGYAILIHEVGHALGLKHSFSGSVVLPTAEDNSSHTVMSYTFLGRSAATPMGYDVLALQYLYGARASRMEPDRYVFTRATVDQYRVGNAVWVTPSGETQQVLWDGGGYNVLDVSASGGSGSGYRIDSRPLGWVTTGAAYQGTYMTAGTQVGPGVRIHEVITSSSADTVYLNAEANVVRGYGPGQSSGTDVIIGGTSADTVDLSGYAASQVTQTVSGTHLVLGLGGDGSLTLQDYYAGFQAAVLFGAGASNQAPTAVVSATPTAGVAPLPVTFTAAGSSDPDGRLVGYAWTFGDGTSGTGVTPSHTYGAAGRYVATVTVTDDRGATAAATVTVSVTAPPVSPPVSTAKNRPPHAALEATPASGSAPLTVQFSGAGSSDPDGSVAAYEWGLGTGATGTGATLAYTYTTPGDYVATVTVTDNRGARNTAAVWITVTAGPGSGSNRPPVAVVAATPVSGAAPLPVSFTAAGSSDPDGNLAGYGWTFGDGATGSGVAAVHTYTTPGSYVATVTVTDTRGATATASTTITVSGGPTNRPPVAVVTATPTSGTAPLTVQFDGTGSSDPEDRVVEHAWTFGDGTTATGATSTHTYASPGTFAATLTVTDARGLTHSASTTIFVSAALPTTKNRAPVARLVLSPDGGSAPLVVSFDGTASYDPDGHVVSYEWSFGNGATASGPSAAYTYRTPGSYVATLAVTDDRGVRNVAATWVVVSR